MLFVIRMRHVRTRASLNRFKNLNNFFLNEIKVVNFRQTGPLGYRFVAINSVSIQYIHNKIAVKLQFGKSSYAKTELIIHRKHKIN